MADLIWVVLGTAILLLNSILCLAQTPLKLSAALRNTTVNSPDIACTRASHVMDSLTAKRLSLLFCNSLVENFPSSMGDNYSAPAYPCDLTLLPDSPDFLAIERSGMIAEFEFTRGTGVIFNQTIVTQGTKEQCMLDNCLEIMESMINHCEWNTHYYGGYNTAITKCGMYTSFVQNCTDNLVDWGCRRWHRHHQANSTSIITSLPTLTTTVSFFTTIASNYTSVFVMTDIPNSGTTMWLPLTPSTVTPGSVTVVPFTPGAATKIAASSSNSREAFETIEVGRES